MIAAFTTFRTQIFLGSAPRKTTTVCPQYHFKTVINAFIGYAIFVTPKSSHCFGCFQFPQALHAKKETKNLRILRSFEGIIPPTRTSSKHFVHWIIPHPVGYELAKYVSNVLHTLLIRGF